MATGAGLQVGDILRRSLDVFLREWQRFLVLGAFFWLILLATILVGCFLHPLPAVILLAVVAGPASVGMDAVILAHRRGHTFDFANLGRGLEVFPQAFLAGLLYAVAGILGFCFCVIGSVVAAAALVLLFPLIADGRRVGEATRESVRYALSEPVPLLVLVALLAALKLVGALLSCTLGLVAILPFIMIASVLVYEHAREQSPRL